MHINDLSFNHTKGLSDYSDLITNVLNRVQHSLSGSIQEQSKPTAGSRSFFSEDEFSYDSSSNNACFGRHLEFKSKNGSAPINFWIGLDIMAKNTQFIVLAIGAGLNPAQIQQKASTSSHIKKTEITKKNDILFILQDQELKDFCDPCNKNYRKTKDIEGFLQDVLLALS